ncbi:thiamine-phosphate kinase [Candidatus Woesearchaeota archaeon]|nr:thiamine-phosphate kinase [Candidatus Woesearchaeota archaeon]
MNIKELGGEFKLIERITGRKISDKAVIKAAGDDCAVLEYTGNKCLLVTTDMLVAGDHFSLEWFTPEQIGMKVMESSVSDIIAMAGKPKYAFISMCLADNTTVEFIDAVYKGLYASAKKHDVLIIGGDTTHGKNIVFNAAILGEADKTLLSLRSGAGEKNLICVTGTLGGSKAGLSLLQAGRKGHTKGHLEPKARASAEAVIIGKYCNAMIDVSDGLASEVEHICEQSNKGAEIYYDKIPISANTAESAKKLGQNARDFALYGGEDFELVFTVAENNIGKLKKEFSDFSVVGKILAKERGIYLLRKNKKSRLKKGFEHFNT